MQTFKSWSVIPLLWSPTTRTWRWFPTLDHHQHNIFLSLRLFTSESVVLKWKRRFEFKLRHTSRGLVLATGISTQGDLPSKHRHYLATGCSLKCDTIKIKLQFSQVHRLPPPPPAALTHRPGNLLHPSVHVRRGVWCPRSLVGQTPLNLTPTVAHYHAADGCVIVK